MLGGVLMSTVALRLLGGAPLLSLMIVVPVGALVYTVAALCTRTEACDDVLHLARSSVPFHRVASVASRAYAASRPLSRTP